MTLGLGRQLRFLALLSLLCCRSPAAVPPAVLDLALEPAVINTSPGPEYSDEQRDYAMVIGMDRTPKGRIWAAWVAGGDSDKGYFVAATSDDDGATWSKPRLVIRPPDAPTGLHRRILVGNFWCDPTGRVWLFYDQSMGYFDGRAGVWAITCDNPDADKPQWSAPRRIWHGATLNKPVVLRNGDWLLPISLWTRDRINPAELRDGFHELDDHRMAHVFVSTDRGASWTRRGGVVIPQSDFDEHMFVELKDCRLWMLARTKQGIAETFSPDGGRTWSEPKTSSMQNPSARFFLRRLASGKLLLVKNGSLDKRMGRSQMTAFVSDDEGHTWKGGLVLDERNGVSYPDGFQSPDGVIHIIHDRERAKEREILMARFKEEDVLAGNFIEPGSRSKILVSKALGPRIGEVIYNGIQLSGDWPPSGRDPRSVSPQPVPWRSHPPQTVPINVGRQLLVDDFLIERTTLTREFHRAEKYPGNPVLKPETPLERENELCPMAAPFSDGVFFDSSDRLFKMWYHAGWFDGTALVTSRDGLKWERPAFDVVPGTNRVIPDLDERRRDGMSVWLDHAAKDPAERFKMFLYTRRGPIGGKLGGGQGRVLASPDGIHWNEQGDTGALGDNTTMFYNPFRKKWVFSIRSSRRQRTRDYWECDDFLRSAKWGENKPVYWASTDVLDQPDSTIRDAPQLYKIDAVAYESLMLGLFEILHGPSNEKCSQGGFPKLTELQVAFSRDGFHWDRPDRQAFIGASRRAGDWERGYVTSAGGCCLVVGDKLYFYYGAFQGNEEHKGSGVWSGMYANASTGLATLRRDGFVSMNAGTETGTLTTRPVAFNGAHLFVNVDCPQGRMRVEVLDAADKIVAPFSKENCEPISADKTLQRVRWKGAPDLSAVAGTIVKFRFHLTNGKLYSFWVSSDEAGASHGYIGAGGPGFKGNLDVPGVPAQ